MFFKSLIDKIKNLKGEIHCRVVQNPPIEGSFNSEDYQKAVKIADNWCTENIEEPLQDIVSFLRANGVNTECSCGHEMYIQCQYVVDGEIMRIHQLVYNYLYEHALPINYEIIVKHKVDEGYISTSLYIQFLEKDSIPWQQIFPDFNGSTALKGARYREGFTQKQLANKLGVSRSTISRMENGTKEIDEAMAKRLSKILNTGYKVFLKEETRQ